jgi:hypothetical protein
MSCSTFCICSNSKYPQGELAHRLVKKFYRRTNKVKATRQIAKHERRDTRLRRAQEAAAAPLRKHAHHVQFSDNDPLPYTGVEQHHHISDSKNYSHHLLSFVMDPPNDPAKKVCISYYGVYAIYQFDTFHLLYRISSPNSKTISLVAFSIKIMMEMMLDFQMTSGTL